MHEHFLRCNIKPKYRNTAKSQFECLSYGSYTFQEHGTTLRYEMAVAKIKLTKTIAFKYIKEQRNSKPFINNNQTLENIKDNNQ